LEEVTMMIFSSVVTMISMERPAILIQETYVVTYDLIEVMIALVIWVFWVWEIASEVRI
jgi:hypothetical protein